MIDNIILQTDSYKLTHHAMYAPDTTGVFSYLEARRGGEYPATVFCGLQPLLRRYLEGARVTADGIAEAEALTHQHLGLPLNPGWRHILERHGGRLPLRICAAPEGSVVPVSNALMTIENTDPAVPWLTNAVESLLLKVWYPTTVATRSFMLRRALDERVRATGGTSAELMLQDFGYRGASSEETAMSGGFAHLLSFRGSDTVPALRWAREYYGAPLNAGLSVAASEHSVMTAAGKDGEIETALRIIAEHEGQIVSLVADSFDYYRFVHEMIKAKPIIDRYHVSLVIRPDSVTPDHQTPEALVLWTLETLAAQLGTTTTATGHKRTAYKVLWGDGIDEAGILAIARVAENAGFAVDNLVFGMGGGLLQKVNRDTCRFAIKCSAQRDARGWRDVVKQPLDQSKASKAGRLTLVYHDGIYHTMPEAYIPSVMEPVFEDGVMLRQQTFADVRARVQASLPLARAVAA